MSEHWEKIARERLKHAHMELEDGNLDEAENIGLSILEIFPNAFKALEIIGIIKFKRKQYLAAIAYFTRCLSQLDSANVRLNLGAVYGLLGLHKIALNQTKRAIALNPLSADAWFNLATVLSDLKEYDQSAAAFIESIKLESRPLSWAGLVGVLSAEYNFTFAIKAAETGLAQFPDCAEIKFNLALAQIGYGDLKNGYLNYEARRLVSSNHWGAMHIPPVGIPEWDGKPEVGKRILIIDEQGFGDMIQVARYAKHFSENGMNVVWATREPLKKLLSSNPYIEEVIECDASPSNQVDCWLYAYSMVLKCFQNMPEVEFAPYLFIDTDRAQFWKEWLAECVPSGNKKVGVVWRGNSLHKNDSERSIPTLEMAMLWNIKNITFVSLQHGISTDFVNDPHIPLVNAGRLINNFSDTAGLIDSLDLVISIDSAPAHLCGALGKPVWVVLGLLQDSRWGFKETTTSLYPTMKLIRRTRGQTWSQLIKELKDKLIVHFNID